MIIDMTTKERIVDEALTLFSIHGFKGTSVKKIADAVGIKDSSIYKHFSSKQEILDAIVEQMGVCMQALSSNLGIPSESNEEAAQAYGKFSLKELQEVSRKVFLFYLQDEFVSRFWRLAIMEQYQNKEFYEQYRHIFMEESIAYLKNLFAEMVRLKLFRDVDPEVIAMNFYTPIFFLLTKYSGRPENANQALEILDKQVEEFCRCYSIVTP